MLEVYNPRELLYLILKGRCSLCICSGNRKHGAVKQVLCVNNLDERQITHLICARLNMIYMTFSGGVFWAFHTRERKEAGPKHPLEKSYTVDHILGGHRLDEQSGTRLQSIIVIFLVLDFFSLEPAQANQTNGRFSSHFAKMGYFSEFSVFSLEKSRDNSQEIGAFHQNGLFL